MKAEKGWHIGVEQLASELDLPIYAAVGVLICMHDWASRYTPKGNIGKYSNAQLVRGWHCSDLGADRLIAALCRTGWIADDPTFRLVIKRWSWKVRSGSIYWHRLKAIGGEIPRSVRRFIFARDGFLCLKCKAESQLTIDHIHPISRGGTNAIENLRTLCARCNSIKRNNVEAPS